MREIYRIDPETGEFVETIPQEVSEEGAYPDLDAGFVDVPPPTLAVRPTWDQKKSKWFDAANKDEKKLREAKREKYEKIMSRVREVLDEVDAAGSVEEVEAVSWRIEDDDGG